MKKLDLFQVYMAEGAAEAVAAVMKSGQIAQGPEVDAFEQELREGLFGVTPVTVNAGTSALHLAMHLAGVGPGDEVITTPQTCLATNIPIIHLGATPVFADIDPATGNIDPDDVKEILTPKTKAIVAVDWAGRACDYDALRSHGIPVIEDAAHAVGTIYNKKHVAETGGDYVCFSFQAIKHLTCGDGGALIVPPDQLDRARRLRWFGLDRTGKTSGPRFSQDVAEAGYKFHLNDIAAAMGRANLRDLNTVLSAHLYNATTLLAALSSVPGVGLPPSDRHSSWWLFTIQVDSPDDFVAKMAERGIGCSPVHHRNDGKSCFADSPHRILPGVDAFDAHQVSIPVGWWLTDEDVERIAEAVAACV